MDRLFDLPDVPLLPRMDAPIQSKAERARRIARTSATAGDALMHTMVRKSDPITSYEAALSQQQNLSKTLQKVLNFINSHDQGVTDEQIAYGLDMEKASAAKRRGDLTKLGLVKDSGRIGLTHNNRKAIIWERA